MASWSINGEWNNSKEGTISGGAAWCSDLPHTAFSDRTLFLNARPEAAGEWGGTNLLWGMSLQMQLVTRAPREKSLHPWNCQMHVPQTHRSRERYVPTRLLSSTLELEPGPVTKPPKTDLVPGEQWATRILSGQGPQHGMPIVEKGFLKAKLYFRSAVSTLICPLRHFSQED